MHTPKKILFFINNTAFFVSHRLPIAEKLISEGHDVILVTGKGGSDDMENIAIKKLANYPISHFRLAFKASSMNPLIEIYSIFQLIYYLLKIKPSVLHCVSPKSVLYGGIAAFFSGTKFVVLAVSGMGHLFSDSKNKPNIFKIILKKSYMFLFKLILLVNRNIKVIVQNQDDFASLTKLRAIPDSNIFLIKGSGVNLKKYNDVSIEAKQKIVLLVGRMLKEKGVYQFIEAAKKLKIANPDWSFVLIGAAGYDNPSSISSSELDEIKKLGIIDWIGHVDDTSPYIKKSSIMCLPSYREGMPKVLLEAAAAGCAIVTTDVPGCREAVEDNVTGLLVPLHNQDKLNEAILFFIKNTKLRNSFGSRAMRHAVLNYGIESVVDKHLEIYNMSFNKS
jgi:glycosyltransferase involved in cell wall biosynthesis